MIGLQKACNVTQKDIDKFWAIAETCLKCGKECEQLCIKALNPSPIRQIPNKEE
jgi:CO dehydrogenase/acetyl-CoA synthase alpha subunit